jgi:hypothetical protein
MILFHVHIAKLDIIFKETSASMNVLLIWLEIITEILSREPA